MERQEMVLLRFHFIFKILFLPVTFIRSDLDAVNVRWEVVSIDEMERTDNETPQELKNNSGNNVS